MKGHTLSFEDISVDCIENPQVVKVRIEASKTDQFCMGVNVYVCGADKLQPLPSGCRAGVHGNERTQARSTVYIQ